MSIAMVKPSQEIHSVITAYGAEVTKVHSRMLRIPLVLEESRAYWEHWRLEIPKSLRSQIAFEERWFGSKSMARVRSLLSEFHHRFDSYPVLLKLLRYWCPSDLMTRQNICHWHTQLTDPIYRQFTGEFLDQRRSQPNAVVDRDLVSRWVIQRLGADWSAATVQRMSIALLTTSTAAGICSDEGNSRQLEFPKVTDAALVYWLYCLRGLSYEGSLLNNPYFTSVGLSGDFLEQRLRRIHGLTFSRMGDLYDFEWKYPDLLTWATDTLNLSFEDSL
jgi:hypothetical protein